MVCPPDDVLLALAEGRLHPVPPSLEAHLDACSICREVVISAAGADPRPWNGALDDAADEVAWVTETPGRYETLGECGRGGQSRVLRVYDRHIGREIALKEFRRSPAASRSDHTAPAAAERCLREVRTVGALSHPTILPVHEVGVREDGTVYYTMPLIEGQTLAEVVARTPGVSARLRLLPHIVQICQAIGFVHARGFLHRDIKPENVMVGPFGETRIIDWGLAQSPERSRGDSEQGDAVLGTPAYMSPEQAAGRVGELDARADVWSLGAMLFFVLTGRSPYEGTGATEILQRVGRGERRALWAPDGEIPPELCAVVDRAMAPDKALRYASAAGMADDVIAFQSGGRVSAYAYAWRERVVRFARRHRALLFAASAVFGVLAVAVVVVTSLYRREAAAHDQAEQALRDVEYARASAEAARAAEHDQAQVASHHLAQAYVEQAERLRSDADPLRSTYYAARALQENPTHRKSPRFEPGAARRFPQGSEVNARALALLLQARSDAIERVGERWPLGPSGTVREIEHALAPGLVYAAANGLDIASVHRLERTGAPTEVARLAGHEQGAHDVELSPGGRHAVTVDGAGTLRLWNVSASRLVRTWQRGPRGHDDVTVSEDGVVAVLSNEGRLELLTPQIGASKLVGGPAVGRAYAMRFSSSGQLAVGSAQGMTILYDAREGTVLRTWNSHEQPITDLAFSPAHSRLAIAGADGKIVVVSLEGPEPDVVLSGHRGTVTSMAFSTGGQWIFTAASDGFVRGFELATRKLLFELEGPSGHIYEVAYDPAMHRVLAFGRDEIQSWHLRPVGESRRFAKDASLVNGMVERRGDTLLLPRLGHSSVGRISTVDGAGGVLQVPGESVVTRIAVVGETALVTSHENGSVVWWTESEGGLQRQRQWNNPKTMPVGLAATEHGRYVAIDAGDGAIAVWQFDRDTPQMLRGHQQTVMSLAFSPDGRFLASAGFDGKVVVWDPSTGERIAVLLEAAGVAEWVTFFGDRLAAAGEFGVRTWRIANWAPGSALSSDPHRYVRFSPQGERLVGLSTENQIAVWDLATREPVIVRRSHPPTQGVLFDGSGEGLWVLTRYAFEYQPLDLAPLQMPADELVRAAAAAAGIVQEPHVR